MNSFIYVAQGKKMLKVGRTTNVNLRKNSLKREFAKYEDEILKFCSFEAYGREYQAEYRLINIVKDSHKVYMGREWFAAGDFEQVCEQAKQACEDCKKYPIYHSEKLTKAQAEKKEAERKQRLADAKQEAIAHKLRMAAQTKHNKLLRVLRRIEIDCIAMWKRKSMSGYELFKANSTVPLSMLDAAS